MSGQGSGTRGTSTGCGRNKPAGAGLPRALRPAVKQGAVLVLR